MEMQKHAEVCVQERPDGSWRFSSKGQLTRSRQNEATIVVLDLVLQED